MKKTLKKLLSLDIMIVLLLFMAFSCAIATFIENDFGPLAAKSFVYAQIWFEAIMLILVLGIIANIIWFKMYKVKKIFTFLIHISLIFIFIGAAMTRYLGYEASMTINEGEMTNKILSSDEFIQANITYKDLNIKDNKKVLMTPLAQSSYKKTFRINNKKLVLEYDEYLQNAVERIVDDENGAPLINLIMTKMMGSTSIDLKDKSIKESKYVSFSLNKKITSSKASVNFYTRDNKIYFTTSIDASWDSSNGKSTGRIKKNTEEQLSSKRVYSIASSRWLVPEASAKGIIKTISVPLEEVDKKDRINALIINATYDGKTKQISLFGKGGTFIGYKRSINFDDINITMSWGAINMTLPFYLKLEKFELERYPGSNAPSSYSSYVKVYDTKNLKESISFHIYMNNVLDYQGYRFFQSSYTNNETASVLSINKDPGKIPTYIGYFLLFAGLIFNLFSKNSQFRKLANKKYTKESIKKSYLLKNTAFIFIMMATIFSNNTLEANSDYAKDLNKTDISKLINIDIKHAKEFGKVLSLDYQGRIKPLNSLAIEITNKIMRTNEFLGLNENQILLSMTIYPRLWQEIKFLKVKSPKLKVLLKLKDNEKRFAFKNIYDENGSYILEYFLELANKKKPAVRDKFDNEIIKIDERLNIAYTVFTGGFLKLFPKIDDANNKWFDPTQAQYVISALNTTDEDLKENEAIEITEMINTYIENVEKASLGGSWENADKSLKIIKDYQYKYGSRVIPTSNKLEAELLFNKLDIFNKLTFLYLILGLILIIFVLLEIFYNNSFVNKISKYTLVLLIIAFFIHTFALGLRWYISGHAPWSNGYESMIYISWAIILAGIFFSKQSSLALATTGILSGLTLFVAHLSWLEPQINTLVPVLKSYWLTLHVSIITASYSFLALSAILGFITLIFFILANPKKEDDRFFSILAAIKETGRISKMAIYIGLVFLIVGNFLGGIWANESWGRYWGWDPKETWTLVSILIYAVIIHLQYVKNLLTDFGFAVLSLISFSSIVMTYFGVNYYLTGKHSYAAGDPLPIPTFVPVSALVIMVLIALAYRNRKII